MIGALRGEAAALAAAGLWAVATVLYGRAGRKIPPLELNVFKGVLALFLLTLTLLFTEGFTGSPAAGPLALLLVSGVIGIGIGDTAYFGCLNSLGARRVLLLSTLSPGFTVLIAFAFLGEGLRGQALLGILLTLAGVAWVIGERTAAPTSRPPHLWRGLALGLLSALAQATAAVLSHAALVDSPLSPLYGTVIRLLGGVAALLVVTYLLKRPGERFTFHRHRETWQAAIPGTLLGTYLAMWLLQVSLKYAKAGISQTLISTSPLFILPLAPLLGERVSWRAVGGVVLAIAGIALLFGIRLA